MPYVPTGRVDVLPYTTWWLRQHASIDGRPLGDLRVSDADAIVGALYDPVRLDLDDGLLQALGVRRSLLELLAEPGGPQELLDRLADGNRLIARDLLRAAYIALAAVDPTGCSRPSICAPSSTERRWSFLPSRSSWPISPTWCRW